MSRIPPEVIDEVHQRSNEHCEACGRSLPAEGGVMHHRKLRKQGGKDEAINLMEVHSVCHNGHTYAIHSKVKRSQRLGHIVKMGFDPADVAVQVEPNLFHLAA